MSAVGTCRVFRPDPRSFDRCEHHHRASFSASHRKGSTVLVTVDGELDATNSRALAGYVEGQIAGTRRLVIDLRLVDFFGTAGFAALHYINVICSRSGIDWEVRCGRQVRRLLAICDPAGELPLDKPRSLLDEVGAGAGDRQLLISGNH
ncbi:MULTISPECIES: STAS domain-containing protein [unclassified Mycobacterium]|uniref:STAS domain-containing protein n=1 Tax=unclassified Mycobacterium TaxID=2642494 RepID=UPI00073FD29F|nr:MULTISPECIES: STAS domain-containing protein [unclassified Mycobacterium]KUH87870.1 anti-anti-sigma factor [Mycobacterium sp. GA-0227b]KUH88625.1 anti-anti-sigma factor [Mycobacterium sp. GA-1999]KUI02681.1 anti-anti-sigma factor [Mycobacterium sp. IS-3022]